MRFGAVELLCVTFGRGTDPADVLRAAVDERYIRLIDLVYLLRDAEGEIVAVDVEDEAFLHPEAAELSFDPHSLLSDDDLETLAEPLGPDEQAIVAVVEHVWSREIGARLDALGATVALHARIPREDVELALNASATTGSEEA